MLEALTGMYLLLALAAAFFASWALVRSLAQNGFISSDWEIRAFSSTVVIGCLLVAVVELSSMAHAISAPGLATAWLCAAAVLFFARRKIDSAGRPVVTGEIPERARLGTLSPEERLILFFSGLIVLILFLLALLTPPTSWDSFTYHLPRILNWMQNGSVAHFATHDTRQVESGPFAAFAVMQVYLLTHSDRLVNLVQWAAMVLSIVGVSWLAAQILNQAGLGQGNDGRIAGKVRTWTILFAVTMPIGIVQSITTQTDYVIAFWVVATAVFGWLLWREPSNSIYAVFFGASIALGTITKATMAVTAGLLTLSVLFFALRRASSNRIRLRVLSLITLTIVLIVTPHFTRNLRVFGSPLGSRYIYALMRNERQSPAIWISNFFRNLGLHSASGIPPLTSALNKLLAAGQSLSGLDPNDRASTFFTSTFAYASGYPVSDNSAGNFWHGLLALLASTYALLRFPPLRKWAGIALAIVLLTFIIQNGYLRWTEWNARFHLPLFLLLAPIAGIGLARSPLALRCVAGLLVAVVGCHAVLFNKSRPVLGENDFLFQDRERQYFIEVPNLYRPSLNTVTDVIASGSTNVGIRLYKNFFYYLDEMEYPFWVMLRNRGFEGKIYNVGISNETARLSNSVPIQTLISSTRGPRSEVAHVFPHVLTYPPIDAYWSESSSRWLQAAQLSDDGTERPFESNPNLLELSGNVATANFRVARQGILSLDAGIARNDSLVQDATALLVKSFAGYANASRSTNARHALQIPLPPGQTAVQFAVPGAPDPTLKLALQWKWEPQNNPLPFVYISRIYDPTNSTGLTTNSLVLLPGAVRHLQVVAGANGAVNLSFYTASTNTAVFEVSGESSRSKATLSQGAGTVQIPVARGTNHFTVQNESPVEIPLDHADVTFPAP